MVNSVIIFLPTYEKSGSGEWLPWKDQSLSKMEWNNNARHISSLKFNYGMLNSVFSRYIDIYLNFHLIDVALNYNFACLSVIYTLEMSGFKSCRNLAKWLAICKILATKAKK